MAAKKPRPADAPEAAAPVAGAAYLVVTLKATHPTPRYHRAGRLFVRGVPQEVAAAPEEAEALLADPHLFVQRQEA